MSQPAPSSQEPTPPAGLRRSAHPRRTHTAPRPRQREKNQAPRLRARELAQRLEELRREFPNSVFSEIFDEAQAAAGRIASGTRRRDRDDVFNAICVQGCRTVTELCEDTGLTRRVVQPILDELHSLELIFITEKYVHPTDRAEGGRPELEYHPTRTLP